MADRFAPSQMSGVPQPFYQYPAPGGDQGAAYGYAVQPTSMYGQPQPAPIPAYSYDQSAAVAYGQPAGQPQQMAPAPAAYGAQPGNPYQQYAQYTTAQYAAPMVPAVTAPVQTISSDQYSQQIAAYNQGPVQPPNGAPGMDQYNNYGQSSFDQGNGYNGQGSFNRGRGASSGMNRGGGGGGGGSQRGGFNKFGGGGGRDNGQQNMHPDGVREDTVFVSSLPPNVDHESIRSNFANIGKIKANSKTNMPMIWIFKERGVPTGEALVTYEDQSSAQSAIQFFQARPFNGQKISVQLATNSQRPVIQPPGGASVGGMGDRPSGGMGGGGMVGGGGMRGGGGGRGRGSFGGGGSDRGGGGGGGGVPREGDWTCESCNNKNFAWREFCNRCQVARPEGVGGGTGGGGRGGGGRFGGGDRGRGGQRGAGGMNRGGNRGGGPMRGGSMGNRSKPY